MYQSCDSTPSFLTAKVITLHYSFSHVFSRIYFIRQVTRFIQLSQKNSLWVLDYHCGKLNKQTYKASTLSYCRLIQGAQKTPGLYFSLSVVLVKFAVFFRFIWQRCEEGWIWEDKTGWLEYKHRDTATVQVRDRNAKDQGSGIWDWREGVDSETRHSVPDWMQKRQQQGGVRREEGGEIGWWIPFSEKENTGRDVFSSVWVLATGGSGIQPWTRNHWAHSECLLYASAWLSAGYSAVKPLSRSQDRWGGGNRVEKEGSTERGAPGGNVLVGGLESKNRPAPVNAKCEWASLEKTRARMEVDWGWYSK